MGRPKNSELITLAEFARRKGVHRSAVLAAVHSGRIALHPDTDKLEWFSQAKAWTDNADPSKVREHNAPELPPELSEAINSLGDARLEKERYNAKLKKLEYDREMGKLIPKDEVKTALFRFTRFLRDGILQIPDRVAAELASKVISGLDAGRRKGAQQFTETELAKLIHRAWDKESRAVMEELSKGPKL